MQRAPPSRKTMSHQIHALAVAFFLSASTAGAQEPTHEECSCPIGSDTSSARHHSRISNGWLCSSTIGSPTPGPECATIVQCLDDRSSGPGCDIHPSARSKSPTTVDFMAALFDLTERHMEITNVPEWQSADVSQALSEKGAFLEYCWNKFASREVSPWANEPGINCRVGSSGWLHVIIPADGLGLPPTVTPFGLGLQMGPSGR